MTTVRETGNDGVFLLLAFGLLLASFFVPIGEASAGGASIEYGLRGADYQAFGSVYSASYWNVQDGDVNALAMLQASSIIVFGACGFLLILVLVAFRQSPAGVLLNRQRYAVMLIGITLLVALGIFIAGMLGHYAGTDLRIRLRVGAWLLIVTILVLMAVSLQGARSETGDSPRLHGRVLHQPGPNRGAQEQNDGPNEATAQPLRRLVPIAFIRFLDPMLAGLATLAIVSWGASLFTQGPFLDIAVVAGISAGAAALFRLAAPFVYRPA